MIDDLATQRLLGEFRGEAAVDRARLVDVLVGLVRGRRRARRGERRRQPADRARRRPPVAVDALVELGDAGRPATPRPAPAAVDEQFRALFEPRGVLVTGASTHPGKFGFVSLHNILACGLPGRGPRHQPAGRGGARHPHRRRHRRAARRSHRPRLRVHPGLGQPRLLRACAAQGREGGVPDLGRLRRGGGGGARRRGRAGGARRRARHPARRTQRAGRRVDPGTPVRPDRGALPAGRVGSPWPARAATSCRAS
jgi:hypothetical protein